MKASWERVDIRSVHLVAATVHSQLDPLFLPVLQPDLTLKYDASALVEGRIVACMIHYVVQADGLLNIDATWRVTYALLDDAPLSESEANDLARVSGVFNSWPFQREYLASLYNRMGLPLPLLPSLAPSSAAAGPSVAATEQPSAP